ncbi:uncharacterized protein LOC144106213 isoform X2 [Amblyomma americanum]
MLYQGDTEWTSWIQQHSQAALCTSSVLKKEWPAPETTTFPATTDETDRSPAPAAATATTCSSIPAPVAEQATRSDNQNAPASKGATCRDVMRSCHLCPLVFRSKYRPSKHFNHHPNP